MNAIGLVVNRHRHAAPDGRGPIGGALLLGSLEAGAIVPIAYIAWSLWLIALGIGLIL